MVKGVMVASALLAVGSVAWGQPGVRTQSCEAVIDAPIERVWEAFTTEEGIEAWMVPVTSIDLRIGGEWRTSYNPSSTLEDADTIVHTIIAYEPMRMIATRTAPPPAAAAMFGGVDFSQLWGVMRFDPVEGRGDAPATRVTITGLGYGQGEAWDRVYEFFEANNPLVLEELARHLSPDPGATDLRAEENLVLELLHRWVGGEWIHEGTPPGGGVFRVRNLVTTGPDGISLLCQGWIGNADGLMPHALAIVRRRPGGGVWFENVNENGDVASGRIRLTGPSTLHWDWDVTRLDASTTRYTISMEFPEDPDRYLMTIGLIQVGDDGQERIVPMVEAAFTRVGRAPEEFNRTPPNPAASSGAAGG